MARFDVMPRRHGQLLVVDCQADVLRHLPTRFVVPLLDPAEIPAPVTRLHPLVDVDGRRWVLATHLAAAVPLRELAAPVASLSAEQDRIVAALDFLLSGF
ncbi:CcdB family protein [Sphingomonas silueang]|uniref:CcdB family protein n=1 Tax=Sphingomonas silueang TaxID=3156617 RepID=UPI0032B5CD18